MCHWMQGAQHHRQRKNTGHDSIHLDSFMYNLILPFETCLHLFKTCSLLRNMKFNFSCLMVIKRVRYVTTDNKLHNGT